MINKVISKLVTANGTTVTKFLEDGSIEESIQEDVG